jgi:DNA repair protein RecN (Recombination protein N)
VLVHLSVEDLGLIERIEFDPGQGLHVLTGETGVGKSMLLASMQMLRGERTRTDMIRRGADRASVRGIFFLHETLAAKVGEILGYPIEDGELIVEREISREGRSRCRIDGRESTAKVLRSIAPLLIEVVGQGQALTLLRSETQLELLDRFGGLVPQRQAHAQAWQEARELEERIHSLEENHRERRDRALFLEHVIHELDEARLEQGERTALEQELELLEERDRVLATISKARERILENDGGVLDTLGVTERDLQGFEALHPGIASLREASLHSRTLLEEAMREVSALESDLDIDPVALDRKRRRLDAIVSLEEKFHRSEENLIQYLDECREELSKISGDSEELPELRDGLDRCIQSLLSGAETLSRARLKVIERLAGDCASELQDLGLEKATLTGRLEPLAAKDSWNAMNDTGLDRFQICFSANPGEPVQPLSQVASGGELSRVMLALQKTLASVSGTGTLVFDEIDSNVGGRMGFAIGRKLREIGESHQVMCVTHLPQVACHGSRQHQVIKTVDSGVTRTSLHELTEEERVEEIASMLRGDRATARSLDEAREMLSEAENLENA